MKKKTAGFLITIIIGIACLVTYFFPLIKYVISNNKNVKHADDEKWEEIPLLIEKK